MYKLYYERREKIQSRQLASEVSGTTATVLNKSSLTYKIERLNSNLIDKYFPNTGITSVIRSDINSYWAKSNKYKAYVAIKNVKNDVKFSFACTCSTGTRVTPCVHGIVLLQLFSM